VVTNNLIEKKNKEKKQHCFKNIDMGAKEKQCHSFASDAGLSLSR